MNLTDLTSALSLHEPQIAEQVKKLVQLQFDRLVRAFGDSRFKNVYNTTYVGMFKEVQPLFWKDPSVDYTRMSYPENRLDDEKVAKFAAAQAHFIVEGWKLKIMKKVGELENAVVHSLNSHTFLITGTREGKTVRIEQQMIINVSSKGKLFNQFPARIRVDGKSMSEKAYAEMVKG